MVQLRSRYNVHTIAVQTPSGLRTYNFYLVQGEEGYTLIDAGMDSESCWHALQETLTEQRCTLSDIDRIVLTHSHPDHIGIVNRIVERCDIPVYAHHKAMPRLQLQEAWLLRRISFYEELYDSMGCGYRGQEHVKRMRETVGSVAMGSVNGRMIPLHDGDEIAGLHVEETIGHSPDHICLVDVEGKQIFSGDLVISHMSSNALVEPNDTWDRLPTLSQHLYSLTKSLSMDVETAFSGHGEPIRNFNTVVRSRIQRINRRLRRVLQLLDGGITVPNDLAEACYQQLYITDFPLVMSEMIGCLDELERRHQVVKRMVGNVWHYATASLDIDDRCIP